MAAPDVPSTLPSTVICNLWSRSAPSQACALVCTTIVFEAAILAYSRAVNSHWRGPATVNIVLGKAGLIWPTDLNFPARWHSS